MRHLILLALLVAGCGNDPVDAEGNYTLSVTNRDNGCNFNNWNVGESFTNIHASFIQSGDGITADFMDYVRVVYDAVLGTHTMGGAVDGDEIDMSAHGTKTYTIGTCTYTIDAHFKATLTGDTLTGRIDYIGVGNGATDCNGINGCVSFQDVNGTRPPT
jgi:hypothetical protein